MVEFEGCGLGGLFVELSWEKGHLKEKEIKALKHTITIDVSDETLRHTFLRSCNCRWRKTCTAQMRSAEVLFYAKMDILNPKN